jgi:hypothetical protein
MRKRAIDRRQFAQEAGLAFLAGVSVTVSACGGGGGGGGADAYGSPTSGSPTATPPPASNKTGQVAANHGHTAVITAAQLQAGGALQLDISGEAGHSHIVDLPAPAVQEIREGRAVQTESTSTDAHTHVVTFNPEAPEAPSRY